MDQASSSDSSSSIEAFVQLAEVDEGVIETAKHLKLICGELRRLHFPLFGGQYDQRFSPEIREKAAEVDKILEEAINKLIKNAYSRDTQIESRINLDENTAEKLKIFMAGGEDFSKFAQEMKKYDSSDRCNAVWPTDTIAYRCNTCAFNPCMSLCTDCFLAADHTGHDYSRFFSLAGGACDCGDEDVLSPNGFCKSHGKNRQRPPPPPPELFAVSEFIVVKLVTRLLLLFRQWTYQKRKYMAFYKTFSNDPMGNVTEYLMTSLYQKAEPIVLFLQEVVNLGGPLQEKVAEILLDQRLYYALTSRKAVDDLDEVSGRTEPSLDWRTINDLHNDIKSIRELPFVGMIYGSQQIPEINLLCLLDEMFFYLMRLGYPQTLINFMLSLLSYTPYKHRFSCLFFQMYPFMTAMIADFLDGLSSSSQEPTNMTNRIIHISVQICSGENLCVKLHQEVDVIDKLLSSAVTVAYYNAQPIQLFHASDRFYERRPLQPSEGELEVPSFKVLDIEKNDFIAKYGHWYLITDAQNLLSHKSIARIMFGDPKLCSKYVSFVQAMQGMNTVWRIVEGDHAEYEATLSAQRAFTLEWETCSTVSCNTISSMNSPEHVTAMSNLINELVSRLINWFDVIYLNDDSFPYSCPPFCVSFHIPLHRHLATTLIQIVSQGHALLPCVQSLLNDNGFEKFLQRLILHPIRLLVARAEYLAGMWARNGNVMRTQTLLYGQSSITHGFQNPDLFIVRFVASLVNQQFFFCVLIRSFYIDQCMVFDDSQEEIIVHNPNLVITRRSWISYLLDGCLKLLVESVVIRTDIGITPEETLRDEVLTALAFYDMPHSKLKTSLPDRGNATTELHNRSLDRILNEVADYQEPDQGDNIQQAKYTLKTEMWKNKVDPVLCRMRSSNKEYNEFLHRVEAKERQFIGEPESEHLWLGYRLIDFDSTERHELLQPISMVLTQPSYFQLMFLILKKCIETDFLHTLIPQQTVYLLTLTAKLVNSKLLMKCYRKLYSRADGYDFSFLHGNYHLNEIRTADNPRDAILRNFLHISTDDIEQNENKESLLDLIIRFFVKTMTYTSPNKSFTHEQVFTRLSAEIKKNPAELDRIYGTGIEYIGRLLCWLYHSHPDIQRRIDELIAKNIVPVHKVDHDARMETSSDTNGSPANEKKQLARRKQQALLKAQQAKNAQLMKKFMNQEGLSQNEMDRMDTKQEGNVRLYECPICNDTTTSTLSNLMGLLVFAQSNSVVENSLDARDPELTLMDVGVMAQENQKPERRIYKYWQATKESLLYQIYEDKAYEIRLPTGVEVKTCGHYAHLNCFQAYIDTIEDQPSSPYGTIYMCPLCRRSINAILPLRPDFGMEKLRLQFDANNAENLPMIVKTCQERITENIPNFAEAGSELEINLLHYSEKFSEFESNSNGRPFYAFDNGNIRNQNFVLGFVKNNIDQCVLKTHFNFPLPKPGRFGIIEHLLAGANIRSMTHEKVQARTLWKRLTECIIRSENSLGHLLPPLLIYDPKSIMLKLCTYVIPDERLLDADKLSICKMIYVLTLGVTLCRAVFLVVSHATMENVKALLEIDVLQKMSSPMAEACHLICKNSKQSLMRVAMKRETIVTGNENAESLVNLCEHLATDLAKFAILFFQEANISTLAFEESENFAMMPFTSLHRHILGPTTVFMDSISFMNDAMACWIRELESTSYPMNNQESVLSVVVDQDILMWRYHSLLELPKAFDDVFSTFFNRPCVNCSKAPRHALVCLICGELTCLDKCCYSTTSDVPKMEVERHTLDCGSGCGCFLSLNSSLVVIIRNANIHLWGSVYLDAYGEEDRNLKRGKPLYLSTNRFERLKRDWLEQEFNRKSSTRWLSIEHLPQILKDCHYYT